MTQHLKLSLWDVFAYYLSGWTVCVSIYIHVNLLEWEIQEPLEKIPPTALGFSALLIPLVAGLLFEPMGNRIGNLAIKLGSLPNYLVSKCCKCVKAKSRKNTKKLIAHVNETIPSTLTNTINPFHWAKDYLSQEKIETSYMAFLSKFGFYRNLGAVLLINAITIPCLHGFETKEKIFFFSLLGGAILYFLRSQKFYQHLGDSVYRSYAVLLARKSIENKETEKGNS